MMPLGSSAPTRSKRAGSRSTSTISPTSPRISSMPATSSKPVVELTAFTWCLKRAPPAILRASADTTTRPSSRMSGPQVWTRYSMSTPPPAPPTSPTTALAAGGSFTRRGTSPFWAESITRSVRPLGSGVTRCRPSITRVRLCAPGLASSTAALGTPRSSSSSARDSGIGVGAVADRAGTAPTTITIAAMAAISVARIRCPVRMALSSVPSVYREQSVAVGPTVPTDERPPPPDGGDVTTIAA